MSVETKESIPQCTEAGCAGRLLQHLRDAGVRPFILPRTALFDYESLLCHWSTERAHFEMNRHTREIAAHRERLVLLLLAEWGGAN